MIKFFLPLLLLSCSPNRMFKTAYLSLSESPCVDGTILNIEQAGCESFYWGTKPDGVTLKVRCTYASENNSWTRSTFYAVPHNVEIEYSNWGLYCEDRYVKMYSIPSGIPLEE